MNLMIKFREYDSTFDSIDELDIIEPSARLGLFRYRRYLGGFENTSGV
jgi:hypothetical protein